MNDDDSIINVTTNNPWEYYFEGKEIAFYWWGNRKYKIENCYLNSRDRELYLPIKTYAALNMMVGIQIAQGNLFYVEDIDEKQYSLIKVCNQKTRKKGLILTFNQVIEGGFLSDRAENIKTRDCKYEFEYARHVEEENAINKTIIQYNKNVSIEIDRGIHQGGTTRIIVHIKSKKPDYLLGFVDYILEMLYLFIGRMPLNGKCEIIYESKKLILYKRQSEGYRYNESLTSTNDLAVQVINENTFTRSMMHRFIRYRSKEEMKTRFDSFLDAANSGTYNNLSCAKMIQILDGYGKNSAEKIERHKKKANSNKKKQKKKSKTNNIKVDGSMRGSLNAFIGGKRKYIKDVFSHQKDDDMSGLKDNLVNLRNNYSHYAMPYEMPFTENELITLKFRLELIIRLIALKDNGICINEEMFYKILSDLKYYEKRNNIMLIKKKN